MGLLREFLTPSGRRKRRERRLDQASLKRLAEGDRRIEQQILEQFPKNQDARRILRLQIHGNSQFDD